MRYVMTALRRKARSAPGAALLLLVSLAAQPVAAQESAPASTPAGRKLLRLNDIFGPGRRVDFSGNVPGGLRWLPDGEHYLQSRDGGLQRVEALTDKSEPAYNRDAMLAALRATGDFKDSEAPRAPEFSEDRSSVLISVRGGLYHYRVGGAARKLPGDGERRLQSFSPRGGFVAFVRNNDLYTIDARDGAVRQLTKDGAETRMNGALDWVYYEELYNRSWRGYWWRDDDAFLAFFQTDNTRVPLVSITASEPRYPRVEKQRYPKPGDPNPLVRLGVVRPAGGPIVWARLDSYGDDFLISNVSWSDSGRLFAQVQEREQRWLDLCEIDPASGAVRVLFRETSPAWVEAIGEPRELRDGTFLWLSERSGFRHIYHYAADGTLLRPVTSGDWEVRELHGADPAGEWVYFSGLRDSPVEQHAYRVRLAGGEPQRLTEPGASHNASFDPTFRHFLDRFSNITTPTKLHLRASDGTLERVIDDNHVAALDDYVLSTPELLRIPARDGWMLNALILRPPVLEPGRKYPIISETYGGPHAPSVHNRWGGSEHMLDQMLAQRGYICWVCDPRSASGESALSAWQSYQRLGVQETQDLEDGIAWLAQQDYADTSRVSLSGFSYGGYMTAYAMTHSQAFSLGIAGAPPTDWAFYDTIYTERYMRTPANNPAGYKLSSVLEAAGKLHGRLMIVHGTMDDNVHFLNSLQLIERLQQAEKKFDLMIYPDMRHGVHGRHWLELRVDYILEHL